MAYSAAQINAIYQAVLQHPADITAIQTYAGSSQQDAAVRTQIETSQEAQINVNPIVRLYQGAFGRLPDASGLQANYNTYINGYNITSLAQSFLSSPEGQAKFGANVTLTAGFVTTVYQQALNRTAGASEISYWTGTGKSTAQVLAEISNSQEAVNKLATPIITYLDAQATSTVALGGSGNSTVGGSLYNQTTTNFTFTANADTIIGSQNNDTFTAAGANVNAGDTINGGGGIDSLTITGDLGGVPGTIQNLAVITINAAQTTANLDFSKATGLSLVTIKAPATGVAETISLPNGAIGGLDNVTIAGTQTFAYGSTATSASLAVANGTGSTAANTVTAAITGTSLATLNVLSTGSSGTTTANTVTVTNDGTAIRTLNISGDRALNLTAGTGLTGLTSIDATANGSNVKFSGTETNLTSAKFGAGNDSFLTGDSFATNAAANTATIDGGAGLNYLGANQGSLSSLLSSSNKVTNFQVLEVQNTFTATGTAATYDLSKIAGLSSLQFDGTVTSTASNTTFNNLTSGGSITFAGDAVTTNAASLVFSVSGAGSNTNDTETVFFTATANGAANAAHNVGAFTLQGVENLVLNNRDSAGTTGQTTFTGIADAQLQTITLQSTTVDATGAAAKASALILGTGFTSNIISTVDATGYNANVDAHNVAGNLSALGATIKGGAGVIWGVGGAGADTITVGSGGGLVNGGAGIDTLNLGSGTNATIGVTQGGGSIGTVLSVAQVSTGGSGSFSTADTINGFHSGATAALSDVLAFNGTAAISATTGAATFTAVSGGSAVTLAAATTTAQTVSNGVTVSINSSGFATVSGATTASAAVNALETFLDTRTDVAAAANKAAALVFGSDTYVVNTGATVQTVANTPATGDDFVVKLAGLSGTNALSISGFAANSVHIA